jgi:hypothetical protein
MVAGVKGWLSATGLFGGIVHVGAGLLQNLIEVDPDLRKELVCQARNEQRNFH